MPATIPESGASMWRRLGWFAVLYVAGVAAVATIALALRVWLKAA